MQIIEYNKLDELIKEYISQKTPLAILVSNYNVSYKQINYIIKVVKDMMHIKDNNAYKNEDYKEMLKSIENIDEKLSKTTQNSEKIKLEYDKESEQEKLIKSSKSIINDTLNIFFNNIDLKEEAYYYANEALAEVLNDYNSNSRVNFIALLTSKIIRIIKANFKEIMGMSFEEYTESININPNFSDVPEIIDIDKLVENNSMSDSLDDEKYESEHFISENDVEKETMNNLLVENIEEILETLPQDEAQVIRLRYGLGGNEMHSFAQIAKELNMTVEMVRNREYKALKKLRHPNRVKKLREQKFNENNNYNINDRIYTKIIDLINRGMSLESMIDFINMEGVNWSRENILVAFKLLIDTFDKIYDLNRYKYFSLDTIHDLVNKFTNNQFSSEFISKLVENYSQDINLYRELQNYYITNNYVNIHNKI